VATLLAVVFATALAGTALAASPVLEGEGASGVTPFGATIEALINPEGETTSCAVEYGKTTSYGSSIECNPASLEGAELQFISAQLTGLEVARTYHFRVVATNGSGSTKGPDHEFSTLPLESPIVSVESVSALTSTHATLNAQVNPNYQETSYFFELADNEAMAGATILPGEGTLPGEFAEAAVHMAVGPLQPASTYYYRVVAKNATGTTEGAVEHFTTTTTPNVGATEAQNVTQISATVTAALNPAGAATVYRVVYADQADYEAAVAAGTDPYNRSSLTDNLTASYEVQQVGPVSLSELKPGTIYHYALLATNAVGTVTGSDATFKTLAPSPPISSTGIAEGVTQSAATLHGSVDSQGLPTVAQFEFGTTPFAGSLVTPASQSMSGSTLTITASFGSLLQPGVTYYYRVVASNRDGTSYGAELSFTTAPSPSPFSSPAALPLLPNPDAAALEEHGSSKPASKPLTKKQKLAKALKACARKPKKQRSACRKFAQKRFGSAKRK
jgi:hypothetical protein